MDRKENLLNIINKLIPEQFIKSSKLIAASCEENSREMVHEFLKAFMSAKEQAMICQDNDEKGKLSYILFSNLYSSFYSDTTSSTSYWDARNIYYLFEEDVKAISKQIETYLPRIREYEVDYIRYAYIPYYHRITKAFIHSMLNEAISVEGFLPCKDRLDNQVHILFGEYMGQADILYILGKEL